jgi:RHS repeat-associated protein
MKRAQHFLLLIVHRPAEDSFVFTSRDHDVDRAMQYNRARCFDPSPGRWLSAEPLACGSEDSDLFPYPPSR